MNGYRKPNYFSLTKKEVVFCNKFNLKGIKLNLSQTNLTSSLYMESNRVEPKEAEWNGGH